MIHSELNIEVIDYLCEVFNCHKGKIQNIISLKNGMTNDSYKFDFENKAYIVRIPGSGTDELIDRHKEYSVYQAIDGYNLCDKVINFNPRSGYKVTEFIAQARTCDVLNFSDVEKCMSFLRNFHEQGIRVEHTFDIFKQIEFYEKLWRGKASKYADYIDTRGNIFALREYVESQPKNCVLTHIDAIPDNFLIAPTSDKQEQVYLIDWEYAGMQDPHVDIAMFCIYSLYEREDIDRTIDIYFKGKCSTAIRLKIYCYIAACGLLWSNWCEYKRSLGIEFKEYSLKQYQYAKDYYRLFVNEYERFDK